MTVGELIQDVEHAIAGRRLGQRPNPETIRRIIQAKWQEFIGDTRSQDGKYTYTTDGSLELELPASVRIVTKVIVDNNVAVKTTPEARDNTNANTQAQLS